MYRMCTIERDLLLLLSSFGVILVLHSCLRHSLHCQLSFSVTFALHTQIALSLSESILFPHNQACMLLFAGRYSSIKAMNAASLQHL